jgi:hypothetical protein
MDRIDSFRSDKDRVSELQDILRNPVLQEALLIVHDNAVVADVAEGSPELASVRKLSNISGRADVIRELHSLATHYKPPTPPPMPTFGVDEPPPENWKPL